MQRSIRTQIQHVWKPGPSTDIDHATAVIVTTAFEGYDSWIGERPLPADRRAWPDPNEQKDTSDFDKVVEQLCPIPREDIYPAFPGQGALTVFDRPKDAADVFFKSPTICKYQPGSNWLAERLLEEAKMNEQILRSPHPALGHYLGCVLDGGRIVRLAFPRYQASLFDRIWHQTALEFPAEQRRDCMDAIQEAADHLHAMGLAHNDISPANIMFDGDGRAVLIDLDAVLPVGEKIVKGGLVAGWKGPLGDNGLEFKQSSAELDVLAIQEIRKHLTEDWERKNAETKE